MKIINSSKFIVGVFHTSEVVVVVKGINETKHVIVKGEHTCL